MKPGEALRQADAAIVGELVKIIPRGDLQADYRYRVRTVYKGRRAIGLGSMISVRGSTRSASCGLPDQAGRSYGLLLSRAKGRWWGGLCGVLDPRDLRSAAQSSAERRKRASIADAPGCSS